MFQVPRASRPWSRDPGWPCRDAAQNPGTLHLPLTTRNLQLSRQFTNCPGRILVNRLRTKFLCGSPISRSAMDQRIRGFQNARAKNLQAAYSSASVFSCWIEFLGWTGLNRILYGKTGKMGIRFIGVLPRHNPGSSCGRFVFCLFEPYF